MAGGGSFLGEVRRLPRSAEVLPSPDRKECTMTTKAPTKKKQEFRFTSPTAMTVQLVGDFTSWGKGPLGLSKGKDGVWRIAVDLEPGLHRYRFLVDGEWRDDPECSLRVPNPFGSENAVREVP